MFYLLSLFAAFFYSLQNAFMARYYRTVDGLSAVAYRGLSFIITMSPLLFFVPKEAYSIILTNSSEIFLAAFVTAIGNFFSTRSNYYLPLAVSNSLSATFSTIFMLISSLVLLKEPLNLQQVSFVFILLGIIALLGNSKMPLAKKTPYQLNFKKGTFYSIGFGLCAAFGFTYVAKLSRDSHPLLIAYLWEIEIGFILIAFAAIRKFFFNGLFLENIGNKKLINLALSAAPTTLGTGFLAIAFIMGNAAIAYAINTSQIVFSCILGASIFHEKFTKQQLCYISGIFVCIAALKLVS